MKDAKLKHMVENKSSRQKMKGEGIEADVDLVEQALGKLVAAEGLRRSCCFK